MGDNLRRKCFKCGLSPSEDPDIKLYRFPKPGNTNIRRCEAWARFSLPDCPWSSADFQHRLYKEHRMLCNKHFKQSEFINFTEKKLHKHAVPDTEPLAISYHDNCVENIPQGNSKTCEATSQPSTSAVLIDITNKQHIQPLAISYHENCVENIPQDNSKTCEETSQPSTSAVLIDITNKQHKQTVPVHEKPSVLISKCDHSTKSCKDFELLKKCKQNLKKICQLKKKIKSLKKSNFMKTLHDNEAVESLSKHLTPEFALILQAQLKNTKRKYKGRRWSIENKIIALRIYKRSATCYRLLRRIWCLPAPSTLKNVLRQFNLQVGLNNTIFNSLKKYIETQEAVNKEYVLLFDEMSIKKNINYNIKEDRIDGYQDHGKHGRSPQEATYALVFMVSGVRKKIKQPVAFYLSSAYVTADRLAVLIKEVLQKCFSIGMNITSTVCDMGGVNRRALNILGASTETPYFEVEGNEVAAIFDPPHLLKCFRNLFLKYDIKSVSNISSINTKGQGIARWKHIEDFYEIDNSNGNFVFAPKLRKDHLNPNSKQKMRVNLAAQVLSHSVAAGMFARISQGLLTSEATTTAEIISNMDKLFDCVNSDTADLKKGKPYLTNFTNVSPHLKLFEEMKDFFTNLEFVGCKSCPPSKQGWIWTLNAIKRVFYNLKKKYNIKSLSTRRLQQDPLENLFGIIRANCGANCNPNTVQFIGGLKTAILSNLAHMGSRSGNCETDNYESMMTNYKHMLNNAPNIQAQEEPTNQLVSDMLSSIEIDFDESVSDSGELQACAYVCGFLLKNLCNTCTECDDILKSKNPTDELYNFMQFKEYDDIQKKLKYASKQLIKCVDSCATVCNHYFLKSSHCLNLKENVGQIIKKNVNFSFLKKCQTHFDYNISFIINSVFHICVKRFCTLKNRQFVEAACNTGIKRKLNIIKHI